MACDCGPTVIGFPAWLVAVVMGVSVSGVNPRPCWLGPRWCCWAWRWGFPTYELGLGTKRPAARCRPSPTLRAVRSASHAADGIMHGGRGRPRCGWDSPG